MSHIVGGIHYELHSNYDSRNDLRDSHHYLLDREKEMSKQIYLIVCAGCNREIARKEEGDYKNPNGTWTSNTRLMIVKREHCPYCKRKETENDKRLHQKTGY